MANSKTPPKTSKAQAKPKIAVAYSGGMDSAVLLHAAVKHYGAKNIYALHIHHGIQKEADAWLDHCQARAQELACHFDYRHVTLTHKGNIEAQARQLRYQALQEMCEIHQIGHVLLAHHQDDQAETVLIQLLRGGGLAGLQAMPAIKAKGTLQFYRPFLETPRSELKAYAKLHHITWVEDPSNQDDAYTRNAIRQHVMPALEKIQAQAKQNLAQSARYLSQAHTLLTQLAQMDLKPLIQGPVLNMQGLKKLHQVEPLRANNALRYYLQQQGIHAPSEERLQAWWQDLDKQKRSAQIIWQHDAYTLRVWKQELHIEKPIQEGEWTFRKAKKGEWGIAQAVFEQAKHRGLINTMPRSGGEKFKTHPDRPRKTLKNLFQEANIPPWQRQAPLLYLGEDLIAVAGLGIHADWSTNSGPRIVPLWQQ